MTEPKFTSGPWRVTTVDDYGDFTIAEPDKPFAIATTANGDTRAYLGDKEQTRANANLIAAAPDMYEALLAAWEFISDEYYQSNRPDGEAFPHEARPVVRVLSAALAKAMGEK